MIQANVLLVTVGKTPDSFFVLDLMRLPLGILTGMGFIGGGAILRRGDMIQGVTTAATLWMATVIGLCLGGGQFALSVAGLALAMIVLSAVKGLELRMRQDRQAKFTVCTVDGGPTEEEIRQAFQAAGYYVRSWSVTYKGKVELGRRIMRGIKAVR